MKKIKSGVGETISETLIALLIAALALVMLAGAIAASSRVVNKGRDKLGSYYSVNNGLVNRSTSNRVGSITISDSASSSGIGSQSFSVAYYENNVFSNNPVIAYKEIP